MNNNNTYSRAPRQFTIETVKAEFDSYMESNGLSESALANKRQGSYQNMTDLSREELDAKLQTIEARMDSRVARIEGKIDAFLERAAGSERATALTAENTRLLMERATDAAERAQAAATEASGLKHTLWITSVTTILSIVAVVIGAYYASQQSNIGIVQSTIAAFESGKNAASPPSAPTKK
jgi:hypothetical protein